MTPSREQDYPALEQRFWFDQPEIHLALLGFLLAFVWEMWQMPFYNMADASVMDVTKTCTLATVGDAALMVLAYTSVSVLARTRRWLLRPQLWMIGTYLLVGLTVTVLFEELATGSKWGWTYSELMPFVPGTRVAVVPLIMWTVVPLFSLFLARRQPV